MLEVQQTLQIAAWRCNDPVQEPVNHLFDGGEHLPVPDDTFAITCRPNVAAVSFPPGSDTEDIKFSFTYSIYE